MEVTVLGPAEDSPGRRALPESSGGREAPPDLKLKKDKKHRKHKKHTKSKHKTHDRPNPPPATPKATPDAVARSIPEEAAVEAATVKSPALDVPQLPIPRSGSISKPAVDSDRASRPTTPVSRRSRGGDGPVELLEPRSDNYFSRLTAFSVALLTGAPLEGSRKKGTTEEIVAALAKDEASYGVLLEAVCKDYRDALQKRTPALVSTKNMGIIFGEFEGLHQLSLALYRKFNSTKQTKDVVKELKNQMPLITTHYLKYALNYALAAFVHSSCLEIPNYQQWEAKVNTSTRTLADLLAAPLNHINLYLGMLMQLSSGSAKSSDATDNLRTMISTLSDTVQAMRDHIELGKKSAVVARIESKIDTEFDPEDVFLLSDMLLFTTPDNETYELDELLNISLVTSVVQMKEPTHFKIKLNAEHDNKTIALTAPTAADAETWINHITKCLKQPRTARPAILTAPLTPSNNTHVPPKTPLPHPPTTASPHPSTIATTATTASSLVSTTPCETPSEQYCKPLPPPPKGPSSPKAAPDPSGEAWSTSLKTSTNTPDSARKNGSLKKLSSANLASSLPVQIPESNKGDRISNGDDDSKREATTPEQGLKVSNRTQNSLPDLKRSHGGTPSKGTTDKLEPRKSFESVRGSPLRRKTDGSGDASPSESSNQKSVTDVISGLFRRTQDPLGTDPKNRDKDKKAVVFVESFDDLPKDAKSLVKSSGISKEKLEANFHVLLHVLYFVTRKNLRTNRPLPTSQIDSDDSEDNTVSSPRRLPSEAPAAHFEFNATKELANNRKVTYKIHQQAGKGGFGRVYDGRAPTNKRVAVKRMPHVQSKDVKRNLHEIGALMYLKHPNIVEYVGATLQKEEVWLVMEFMEGGTLSEATRAHQFTERQIAYVAREMLLGIIYLHEQNLVHRDLKSSNVMMGITGRIKLIDFGLCCDVRTCKKGKMAGSPYWMPPEMIRRRRHSFPIDIWSFAICVLELANRNPPNKSSQIKAMFTVATEGLKHPLDNSSKWTDVFKNFLSLCLVLNPRKRATAKELIQHPFIASAETTPQMQRIFESIFLSNTLSSLGTGF